ncbi:MAG: FAD-binding protein [Actinomycetota bacterium]|nr:FAD-binding protein [Actinomycetota bacterium]
MEVVVALKQVPKTDVLALDESGRLARAGVAHEMNAYCRRALRKGIEIASASGGRCRAVSLGPPTAEEILREALACGADGAILLSDPVFAGSDTIVTARALAALIAELGHVDLVLVGKASLDAETGQVGPQLAQFLDLPFAGAVRELDLDRVAGVASVRCELDDGGYEAHVSLPAVLALAERSCRPAKGDPALVAAVPRERVVRRTAADLAVPGPWGAVASPTTVEGVVPIGRSRGGLLCGGPVEAQVRDAIRLLVARGAFVPRPAPSAPDIAPAAPPPGAPPAVVVCEPERMRVVDELLGTASRLARALGGSVSAFVTTDVAPQSLWERGADGVVQVSGVEVEEDVAAALAAWAQQVRPPVILAPATSWGREVAARAAVRLGAGLVADALDLEIVAGRLSCAKPACAGGVVATIGFRSPIQMATVRPGALAPPGRRVGEGRPVLERLSGAGRGRVSVFARWRDADVEELERADVVVGVGLGVAPEDYDAVRELAAFLGAELGATRKVTDRGLLPHARQIGITGRSIAPRLYVALGVSGSHNHLAGVRRAESVLAVNVDASAPIFAGSDVGIVGDVRLVLAELFTHLRSALPERNFSLSAEHVDTTGVSSPPLAQGG